jgi:hypothetical protein
MLTFDIDNNPSQTPMIPRNQPTIKRKILFIHRASTTP